MTTPEATRLSKLPVWARHELQVARMRLAEAKAKLAALFPEAETNTCWLDSRDQRPLPNNATVQFRLGDSDIETIDVRIERGGLYVNCQRRVSIRPEASNSFRVTVEERP